MAPDPTDIPPPRILVVDDEPNICQSCVKILSKQDYDVRYALNGFEALKLMEEDRFDVIVTDLKMSRLGGMELLSQVTETYPDTRVVVITGYASVASAVEVMKMGAYDYLPKPFTPHELRAVVFQALSEKQIQRQNQELMSGPAQKRTTSHQLIGSSPKIQKVISMVEKVAPTDSTVLVYGESGTGKELIARAVHANSRRSKNVFFAVDCGTLSGNRLESELFGHVKGAYTSAHKSKEGILSYSLAVRSLDGSGPQKRGVTLNTENKKIIKQSNTPILFTLTNTGAAAKAEPGLHPSDARPFLNSDVYRLSVSVEGEGWTAQLLNALTAVEFGESQQVMVYVSQKDKGSKTAKVTLRAKSESDPSQTAAATVQVSK